MEHNFNPNKGDYKYILEEERRKENGEQYSTKVPTRKGWLERIHNFLLLLFFDKSNRRRKAKASIPFVIQLFG